VRLKPGRKLAPQNITAIDHLVASAVEGLSPDAVTVLDMNGNLLGKPRREGPLDGSEPSAATLEYRHQIEADLQSKIAATLGPLLGAEKFRSGVSVECDFSGGEQSEEVFDPARSVMVSSQRTEDGSGSANASGVPGTASTLPRPTSRPGSGSTRISRTTENITYQSSRTVKKLKLPGGTVRRLSVSVLVDQDVTWEKEGMSYKRVLVPPAPEKLKVIRDLVAGIIGFDDKRGDQLIIETLPFETTLLTEPPAAPASPVPGPGSQPVPGTGLPLNLQQKQIVLIAAGAGVLILALAALVIRRLRRKKNAAAQATTQAQLPGAAGTAGGPPAIENGAGEGVAIEKRIEEQIAERDAAQKRLDDQTLASLKITPVISKKAEVLAKHLREKVASEPEMSVQILRTWMREEEN